MPPAKKAVKDAPDLPDDGICAEHFPDGWDSPNTRARHYDPATGEEDDLGKPYASVSCEHGTWTAPTEAGERHRARLAAAKAEQEGKGAEDGSTDPE